MSVQYSAVSNTDQGSFNNPRQKTWATMQKGATGWYISYSGGDFDRAKEVAGNILRSGGMFTNINRVMLVEIVPMDLVITPSV